MNRLVSREDQKRIQLEMLIEIDRYCTENGLKYSLAFGTLLGAIRHKGFIPWDDDVDIMMPVEDMIRFKETFHSDRIKYCDVDTEPHFEYAFSRVVDQETFRRIGRFNLSYGVCVDLYPVIPISNDNEENAAFFKKGGSLLKKRLGMIRLNSFLRQYLPIRSIPGFDKCICNYRDHLLGFHVCPPYRKYYVVAGHISLREKMIYDFDLFDRLVDVEFEGRCFKSTFHYDRYLSLRYGNYMELPPIEDRVPYHGGRYFWG